MIAEQEHLRRVLRDAGKGAPAQADALAAALRQGRVLRRRRRHVVQGCVAAVVAIVAVGGALRLGRDDDKVRLVPATAPSLPTDVTSASTVASASSLPAVGPSPVSSPAVESLPVETLPTSPAAAPVVAADKDGNVVQIDALTGATTPIGKLSFVPTDLVLASDQKTIYAGRPGAVAGDSLPTVDVVRWRPGGQEADVATGVTAFALSPDGTRLAMAMPRGVIVDSSDVSPPTIVERDLASGSERSWVHAGYQLDLISQLNYSPDASHLAYSAVWETSEVYAFAVDSAGPPVSGIAIGSKEVLSDSFDGVDWLDNNTLVVVGNCCYAEGSHPSELLTIRTTGELLKRQELDHSVAVDVDPATGRWVVQRQVSDTRSTTFVSLREADGTVRDFASYLTAAI